MTFGKYRIVKDGETAALMLIGKNQKTGEETLKPVAYVRDLLGALHALKRKMSVDEFNSEPNIEKLIELIEKNHEDLIHLVKSKSKECLQ